MKHSFLALLFAGLCAGCATPQNTLGLTAEQLSAIAKDKNVNVFCSAINTTFTSGTVVSLVIDRGIITNGTLDVGKDCAVTFTQRLQ